MRKITAVLAVGMILAGLVISAPVASAVPVVAPQVVGYDRHQGQPIKTTHNNQYEIYRSDVAGDCLIEKKFYPSALVARQLSAVLLWVPAGNTRCNYLQVTNGSFNSWGKCITRNDWGYDFGADYNDDVWIITVKRVATCPNW